MAEIAPVVFVNVSAAVVSVKVMAVGVVTVGAVLLTSKSTTRLLVVAPVTIDAIPPVKSPFAKVTVRLLMSSAFA